MLISQMNSMTLCHHVDTFDHSELTSVYRVQDYFPPYIKEFIKGRIAYIRKILVDYGFMADDKHKEGQTKVSRALQKARDAHSEAIRETSRLRGEVDRVTSDISADCGPGDVFRAIKEECVSLDAGEYTYTVCIMDKVSQKSNKDGMSMSLGCLHKRWHY